MLENNPNHLTLKSWAEEDRPREKLVLKGKSALSDAELVAILISSGNGTETAVELSRRILESVKNDLNELSKQSLNDLNKFKGIGEAKALSIIAALELGRRRKSSEGMDKKKIATSKDAADIFQPMLADNRTEEFWILLLNRANGILGTKQISHGGMTGTVADSKVIFSTALEYKAISIILCHNHPSGNLKPSDADIRLTKRLKLAGDAIEIGVIDHLIVSENGYFSFADEGMM